MKKVQVLGTGCPKCKQIYDASPDERRILLNNSSRQFSERNQNGTNTNKIQLSYGPGCDTCMNSGYSGRRALYEILSVSREIRELIVNLKSDEDIKLKAIAQGMKTLREDGIEQVLRGQTTLDEILRVVDMRAE